MSDFVDSGWSLYVGAATFVSLIACLVLLAVASRRKVTPGDDTTGHVWDGDLRELNNPLPRWWVGLFVITVLMSFVYLWFYPGLGSYDGSLRWSSVGQYEAETAHARAAAAPIYARFDGAEPATLVQDPQAMAIGERLFINHCATCHGSDARGSKGFPNLTDSDWLWGGDHASIAQTIAQGRQGAMPPMAEAVGGTEGARQVAHYVLSLSDSAHNTVAAHNGRSKFAACAACHGVGGKGNPALGAPNLTDKVWLHGWGEQAIVSIVTSGKINVMPAHAQRLTPAQIHVLAAYVQSLGAGAPTAARADSR
jgi:cytochrome c oxidase cbb3-type subunit 3